MVEVLGTDEFDAWYQDLTQEEAESVAHYVGLLEARGVTLPFPYSSGVNESRHGRMRELRIQHKGEPYRVFYCFDPSRQAILLIGGCKTGDDDFYEKMVPAADQLYDDYLREHNERGE